MSKLILVVIEVGGSPGSCEGAVYILKVSYRRSSCLRVRAMEVSSEAAPIYIDLLSTTLLLRGRIFALVGGDAQHIGRRLAGTCAISRGTWAWFLLRRSSQYDT